MAKFLGAYFVGGIGYWVPKDMEPVESLDEACGQILAYGPRIIPRWHKCVVTGDEIGTKVLNLDGNVLHEWFVPFSGNVGVYYCPGDFPQS